MDRFLIPFSLMWGGFAIIWETLVISQGAGAFFDLWGIPFVGIGIYFIFGRFIYKSRLKKRTVYAITNDRVMRIVEGGGKGARIDATYLSSISNISASAGSDGQGSVGFGASSASPSWYGNTGMEFLGRGQAANVGISFYDIDDPAAVAAVAERLRRSSLATRA